MSEVDAGYSFPQAAERAGLHYPWVRNALYSDNDLNDHCLLRCMAAGELIRQGKHPVPDRRDGLYEKYRNAL